jgi:hypothetical protein
MEKRVVRYMVTHAPDKVLPHSRSHHISDSEKIPNCVSMFCMEPPGTYSRMMKRYFSDWAVPRYLRVSKDAVVVTIMVTWWRLLSLVNT